MINQFDGEYKFLSNFYEAPVKFEGILYTNNESAFQSAKLADRHERKQFANLPPNEAKRLGRQVNLRHGWEEIKDEVMEKIVRDKFVRNRDLCEKLIQTGDAFLIEGNWWHDNYWGTCGCVRCKGNIGYNKLGRILMKIRDEAKMFRTAFK